MRVRFQMSGGIAYLPGLASPRTIDVDALDTATRDEINALLRETDFFTLTDIPAHPGAADYCTYRISVEDGARRHTVSVTDPVPPGSLQRLVELLRSL